MKAFPRFLTLPTDSITSEINRHHIGNKLGLQNMKSSLKYK